MVTRYYLYLGSCLLGPYPQNARQNNWWLVTCCSDNPCILLYLNQSKKEKQTLSCSSAHFEFLWVQFWTEQALILMSCRIKVFPLRTMHLFPCNMYSVGVENSLRALARWSCWVLSSVGAQWQHQEQNLDCLADEILPLVLVWWPWNLVPDASVFDLDQEGEWSGTFNWSGRKKNPDPVLDALLVRSWKDLWQTCLQQGWNKCH